MSNYVSMNIRMYASKTDPVMEKIILNLDWNYYAAQKAYEYSKKVLKKRWPQGERKIKKNPYIAYLYARHVIGARWAEAEDTILKCSNASYLYSKYVIKGRWEKAEKKKGLFKSAKDIYLYSKYVLKSRWKEKEQAMLKSMGSGPWFHGLEYVVSYCVSVKKSRWIEIEDAVSDSYYIEKYMKSLKSEGDKEEFYNKVLARSLTASATKYYFNHASDYIRKLKPAQI